MVTVIVGEKAVIDKRWREAHYPSPAGCKDHGTVVLRAVLNKSKKVTNIKVLDPGNCSDFAQRAVEVAENTKFKSAMKNGSAVSTYIQFEFNYSCGGRCP